MCGGVFLISLHQILVQKFGEKHLFFVKFGEKHLFPPNFGENICFTKTHNTHFLHPFIIFPIKMIKPLGYKGKFLTTRVVKKPKKLYKNRPVAAAAPLPDDSPPPAPEIVDLVSPPCTPELVDLTIDDDDSDAEEPPVAITPVLSIHDPNHEDFNNVYCGPSNFRGIGLFAKRDIAKHERICWYDGQYVRTAHAEGEEYNGDYLFRIDDDWSIDSSYPDCSFGRYVDDCIEFEKYNSEFAIDRLDHPRTFLHLGCVHQTFYRIALFAIRDIKQDDPIYATYGNKYWADPLRFFRLSLLHRTIMYRRSQTVRQMANHTFPTYYHRCVLMSDDVVSNPELQVDYLTRDF